MKKMLFKTLAVTIMMLAISIHAFAQSPGSIKGQWNFNLRPPAGGSLPVPVTFKSKGKGSIATPVGVVPLIFRETATIFSAVLEFPMGLPQDGSDVTIVVRGNKVDSNTLMGTAYFITDIPDPGNPIGFVIIPFVFDGTRQK